MAGRFRVLEVLGSGGVAHVVRARRLTDGPEGPEIALKVVREGMAGDAQVCRRFRDEARILEALDHPSVVRALGLHDYEGRLVMELELVEGTTLERALGALGPIPTPVALGVVRQAAQALRSAWSAPGSDGRPMRIVHRDLKPANLALSREGGLKLLDFGYAKGDFEGRAAQSVHDVWGTIGFDAPERKQGQATQAADVYALGVTLYVARTTRAMLISTKEAHHDEDLAGALQHLEGDGGGADEALRRLVRDCMGFDPTGRLSLEALIARIDALVPEDTTREALGTWCRDEAARLWRERMIVDAHKESSWSELAFLETESPSGGLEALSREEGRGRVEAFLATPDWPRRVAAVDPVLDATADPDPAPFTAVLDRAVVPFWKPWVSAARPDEVEAALLLLVRVDAELARQRARSLAAHPDERVREAAEFVLRQA